MNYRVLEVRVRQLPTVKIPSALAEQVALAGENGWEVDRVVPVMAKGLLGGSYTDTLLVFLKREEPREEPLDRGREALLRCETDAEVRDAGAANCLPVAR